MQLRMPTLHICVALSSALPAPVWMQRATQRPGSGGEGSEGGEGGEEEEGGSDEDDEEVGSLVLGYWLCVGAGGRFGGGLPVT